MVSLSRFFLFHCLTLIGPVPEVFMCMWLTWRSTSAASAHFASLVLIWFCLVNWLSHLLHSEFTAHGLVCSFRFSLIVHSFVHILPYSSRRNKELYDMYNAVRWNTIKDNEHTPIWTINSRFKSFIVIPQYEQTVEWNVIPLAPQLCVEFASSPHAYMEFLWVL